MLLKEAKVSHGGRGPLEKASRRKVAKAKENLMLLKPPVLLPKVWRPILRASRVFHLLLPLLKPPKRSQRGAKGFKAQEGPIRESSASQAEGGKGACISLRSHRVCMCGFGCELDPLAGEDGVDAG